MNQSLGNIGLNKFGSPLSSYSELGLEILRISEEPLYREFLVAKDLAEQTKLRYASP